MSDTLFGCDCNFKYNQRCILLYSTIGFVTLHILFLMVYVLYRNLVDGLLSNIINPMVYVFLCGIAVFIVPFLFHGLIQLHDLSVLIWIIAMGMLIQVPLVLTFVTIFKASETAVNSSSRFKACILPILILGLWLHHLIRSILYWKTLRGTGHKYSRNRKAVVINRNVISEASTPSLQSLYEL